MAKHRMALLTTISVIAAFIPSLWGIWLFFYFIMDYFRFNADNFQNPSNFADLAQCLINENGKLLLDAKVVSSVLVSICRFLTGIRAKQTSPVAKDTPCIYYANHSSHLDGLVIWSCLSPNIRPYVHCRLKIIE